MVAFHWCQAGADVFHQRLASTPQPGRAHRPFLRACQRSRRVQMEDDTVLRADGSRQLQALPEELPRASMVALAQKGERAHPQGDDDAQLISGLTRDRQALIVKLRGQLE